jgi:thiosulfate dehydrogenase [quinone] large subunit
MVLPLRAFLGITFVYAGLQKLADRWFFSAAAPSSIQSQLHRAARTSPVGGLVSGLTHHAVLVGLAIAFVELAIGLGALLGLWTRATAALGMALSLGFLLTLSWHARPFYYGADIVFLFAWTPLLIGGPGPMSIDALTRAGVRHRLGLPSDPAVIIGFDAVRQLCGAYVDGHCKARRDHRCAPDGCPVLAASAPPAAVVGEVDRRAFMQKAGIAGWLGAAAVVGGGIVALIGRVAPVKASKPTPVLQAAPTSAPSAPSDTTAGTAPSSSPAPGSASASGSASAPASASAPGTSGPPASSPSATAPPATAAGPTTEPPPPPPGLTALGPTSAVAVGGAASFTDPSSGVAAFVVQPTAGRFVAFDAACTHQGCPVRYAGSKFECPCHGAQFDSATGEVLQGPASSPLRKIGLTVSGGTLYAK